MSVDKLIKAGMKMLKKPMAKSTTGSSAKKMNAANAKDQLERELLTFERMKAKGKKGLEDRIMMLKYELRKGAKPPSASEHMKMPKMRRGNLADYAKEGMDHKREKVGGKPLPDFLTRQAGPKVKAKKTGIPKMLQKQAY